MCSGASGSLFLVFGMLLGVFFVGQCVRGEPLRVRPLMLFGAGLVLVGIQFVAHGAARAR